MRRHSSGRSVRVPVAAVTVVLAVLAGGCVTTSSTKSTDDPGTAGVPKGATVVDMAISPEKLTLLTELAAAFNKDKKLYAFTGTDSKKGRAFIRVQRKASGAAASALIDGWDEASEGPRPVVWSPAASSWGAVVNQRLADAGKPAIANNAVPFMLTPLVIAMPRPMAAALGYPKTPVGFSDILQLAQDPTGWGSKGHPEWGPFKLGKTNPNFSTSGLSATIAQYYAAVGKQRGLSLEDLAQPKVAEFSKAVESSVVHYGDTTLTFLNNWYRADQRGNPLGYVSAAAVEEKSVIDYNRGDPDGVVSPGETPRKPRIPLVAIYPKDGTLFSDNPLIILDADWVSDDQKTAAKLFSDYVQLPDNQRKVLEFGFRPGNAAVAVGPPIISANGVDPDQPTTALQVPEPKVLTKVLDLWAEQRKGARVLLVIDVSGSMGEQASKDGGETKLDLAQRAAIAALGEFKADDLVGLRVFSSGIGPDGSDTIDLVPIGPIGQNRELMATKIRDLVPTNGTPLYVTTEAAVADMKAQLDPTRINAVVLLTDGKNDDNTNNDETALLSSLRKGSEGQTTSPVRVFPIAYGSDADVDLLGRIAEATNANVYVASDPRTIEKVFLAVVSNF